LEKHAGAWLARRSGADLLEEVQVKIGSEAVREQARSYEEQSGVLGSIRALRRV